MAYEDFSSTKLCFLLVSNLIAHHPLHVPIRSCILSNRCLAEYLTQNCLQHRPLEAPLRREDKCIDA